MVLQLNENKHGPKRSSFRSAYQLNGGAPNSRMKILNSMWIEAVKTRNLPPNLEMLVCANDKPRVIRNLGLPTFSLATEYPAGMGLPREWKHHVPYPSHLHFQSVPRGSHSNVQSRRFEKKQPKVYFRGRLSETCWSHFDPGRPKTHCTQVPRFRLANATRHTSDEDVLDVKMTGVGVADVNGTHERIWRTLENQYNISGGQRVEGKLDQGSYRYILSSPSKGWAGTTTMNALLLANGACVLFVNDITIDDEGITRELGEAYFPFLKPNQDMVVVQEYDQIATVARRLNAQPDKAKKCGKNGYAFAKKFLGRKCALDLIELVSWSYYRYVKTGCPRAFNHVRIT